MAERSPMKPDVGLVVLTDLDGTLLDHETYSYSQAQEALDLLKAKHIPLVFCSSKTRAEIEVLQHALELRHPFISENGGAVFVPKGYFPFAPAATRDIQGYEVLETGTPYRQLVETLHRISARLGVPVVGFGDMSVKELAGDSKLTLVEARRAKQREYDEPFRILSPSPAARSRLLNALREEGLRCTKGGRYYHVTGVTDKGLGVRKLRALYCRAWGSVLTVGLGDSPNDLALLQEVDIPIVVRNPAVGAATRLLRKIPRARASNAPGPRGWNEMVLEAVRQHATSMRQPQRTTFKMP